MAQKQITIVDWVCHPRDLSLGNIESMLQDFRNLTDEPHTRIISLPADFVGDADAVLLVWTGPEEATDEELVAAFSREWEDWFRFRPEPEDTKKGDQS